MLAWSSRHGLGEKSSNHTSINLCLTPWPSRGKRPGPPRPVSSSIALPSLPLHSFTEHSNICLLLFISTPQPLSLSCFPDTFCQLDTLYLFLSSPPRFLLHLVYSARLLITSSSCMVSSSKDRKFFGLKSSLGSTSFFLLH